MDAVVVEIGSTTTVVSAFDGLAEGSAAQPRLLGQGFALTSVADGDVSFGVLAARAQLEAAVGPLAPGLTLATSSAAGGLRMTVHGLTQRMTAMAAREAALGAGAVVKFVTAGPLRDADLRQIDARRHAAARKALDRAVRPRRALGGHAIVRATGCRLASITQELELCAASKRGAATRPRSW